MTDLLTPGQIFAGRYRIERFLAKGGFGAVYAAEQIETELAVALKVLWPHVLFSQDAVEKFKLEARVAGRVGSEHIVKVFDAGFDSQTEMPFLVMELLRGAHLEHVVATQGGMRPEALVTYFRQIASALDRAHRYVDRDGVARPIVHRDLKPENLFLAERETGEPFVKILDFGIAKVLSNSTNVSQEVKGTPLYMAFEQAAGGKVTPQTDIWPLGLIAFFLLTGRTYWKTPNREDGSLTQLFGEVLSLAIEPASQRARELGCTLVPSAAFDAWFARCVHREPAARFASAGECAAGLASALLGAAPAVAAGSATVPLSATALTPAPAAPIASDVSRSGSVGATTAQPLSLGTTGVPAVPKKSSVSPLIGVALLLVAGLGVAAFTLRGGSSSADAAASASAAPAVATAATVPPLSSPPPIVVAPPSLVAPPEQPPPAASVSSVAAIPPPPAKTRPTPGVAPPSVRKHAASAPAPEPPKKTEVYEDR